MANEIIDIGTKININDLIESRMLIQANSGGGKSGIARVMMEESFGKVPFIVLDKKGEYYSIKEKFPEVIVIGGRYGDIPLSLRAAPLLAKFIIKHMLTVIIDMSDMESDEQRAVFIRDFLKGMMNLNEDYWTQYLVFLEEAHLFCGQQDKMPSGRYVKNLMSEGRKMGYCGILITQRISKLHKDAAAECNNKFIGRTFLDVDIDRSAKEMGLIGQEKFKLRDLKPRHFWAFGTSIQPHHVHEVLIKEAQTKFPKAGAKINIAPKKPTEKIKEALSKLNELPKEAAKELKTIEDLQKEVSRLTKELKAKQPSTQKLTVDYSPQLEKMKISIANMQEAIGNNKTVIKYWRGVATSLRDKLVQISKLIPESILVFDETKEAAIIPATLNHNQPVQITKTNKVQVPVSVGNGILGKCSREIIKFLAQFKDRQFTKAQVAIATGYSSGSGGFNNALSELNQKGFILRGGRLQVNSEAMQEITECIGSIPEQEYNIETYRNNLAKCEREIYDVLLANPDKEFSKDELSQSTETPYSSGSGGFNNALSRLNTLELIERRNGSIKLNPELLELMN